VIRLERWALPTQRARRRTTSESPTGVGEAFDFQARCHRACIAENAPTFG
jgi:hypothetical protein